MADLLRVLVTTQITATHVFAVDGVPADAAGDITATIKRLDGTAVGTPGTATHVATGTYTYPIPASALLDSQTLDWSGSVGGAAVSVRDYVEHVGGFIFDLSRAYNELKLDRRSNPPASVARSRTSAEIEAENIAGCAFVPRFARYCLDGTGTTELPVPDMLLRAVRSVSIADRYGNPFTALSAGELAAVAPSTEGVLYREDGALWPAGRRNVIVEYEHGMDFCPPDVADMAVLRLRAFLSTGKTAIPDRAVSFTVTEGGVYTRFATATKRSTGFADVDAVYQRHGFERFWIAQ